MPGLWPVFRGHGEGWIALEFSCRQIQAMTAGEKIKNTNEKKDIERSLSNNMLQHKNRVSHPLRPKPGNEKKDTKKSVMRQLVTGYKHTSPSLRGSAATKLLMSFRAPFGAKRRSRMRQHAHAALLLRAYCARNLTTWHEIPPRWRAFGMTAKNSVKLRVLRGEKT